MIVAAGDLAEPGKYFIIDTSSLIEIRQLVPAKDRRNVLGRMSRVVASGTLVFPTEVVAELERYEGEDDPIRDWAVANRRLATRISPPFEKLRAVMTHSQVKRVIDPDKATSVDEADPYVLALALSLKDHAEVVVITEETKDRRDRISMGTACGLLRLFRLPVRAFLIEQKIWSG